MNEEEIRDIQENINGHMDKYIEESNGWCCELCGDLIKGKCYNINGFVTHINQCSMNDEDSRYDEMKEIIDEGFKEEK